MIVDVEIVKAVVSVLESDLSKLKLKDEAWVQLDALTEAVLGAVSLISPILEPAKRSAKVEIRIDNDEMDLRPGMFARVRILVEVHDSVILIPRSAVIEGSLGDTGTVFAVEESSPSLKKAITNPSPLEKTTTSPPPLKKGAGGIYGISKRR